MDLIRPAVDGTLSALRACRKHKVKRVVVTSSVAAIEDTHPDKSPEDDTWNESHWSDPDRPEGMSAYAKSKVLAEKAAWEYQASIPEDERFELSVINPSFVLGPTNVGGSFASGDFIGQLMMNKLPAIPKVSLTCVDVRNVAQAHAKALMTDEA